MKIVIFGLTISSSWGNGHATLWRALCRALASRGHTTMFFERDVPYYAAHRDLAVLSDGELVLYGSWDDAIATARRALADADVGIVTSYCADAISATELLLDSPAGIKAFYDMDTPITLGELRRGRNVGYIGRRGLSNFDLVLSYTGGRALRELVERLGARRVVTLYGSADPEVHHPAPTVDWCRGDLSYLGTYAEDRQAALRELLVEPARQLRDCRFVIAGAQYPEGFPWNPNIYFVRHLAPGEHAAFYSSSRLTLNVTRRDMAEMGYCPSGRLFEAAACATAVVSDWWEGLDQFFTPGEEILVAHRAEDVISALRLPEEVVRRIAAAARERALDEHTPERRAIEFEAAVESARSSDREIDRTMRGETAGAEGA